MIPVTALIILGLSLYFGNLYPKYQAGKIIEWTGIEGGLVAHVNCGDGQLTAGLRANDQYVVHGISRSDESVEQARDFIQKQEVYGKVSIDLWQGEKLPYSDDLVNLLVIDQGPKVSRDEIMRVLAPKGVAMVKKNGDWIKRENPWPSKIDDWTHYLHGPDGNQVARDSVAGPPRHIKWRATPEWTREHRYGNKTAMVSTEGRLFYVDNRVHPSIENLPDRPFLVARNAFNGVLLWKKPIYPRTPKDLMKPGRDSSEFTHFEPKFPMELKVVAIKDRLYTAFGEHGEIQVLDAATGKLKKTFEGTEHTEEILYADGVLLTVAPKKKDELKEMNYTTAELNYVTFTRKRANILRAIDPDSGDVLWEYDTGDKGGLKVSPIIKNGDIFIVVDGQLIKLDLSTGKQDWRKALPDNMEKEQLQSVKYIKGPSVYDRLIAGDEVILLIYNSGGGSTDTFIRAFSQKKGKQLWSYEGISPHRAGVEAFIIEDKVWVHKKSEYQKESGYDWQNKPLVALDIKTGKELQHLDQEKIYNVGHHHRCYGNRATSRFLLTARRGTEFTNFKSGEIDLHHWVRGKCRFGVLPCNGLLYSLPHACSCYPYSMFKGYSALAPEGASDVSEKAFNRDEDRLVRGPNYGEIKDGDSTDGSETSASWPTYRHDGRRSGSTPNNVNPENLRQIAWSTSFDKELSGMTAGNGRLFVCTPETHQVHTLDMNSGEVLWSYTAGGRVDSPPTLYNNMVIFGSKNGYVYCLRADSGRLVWRFRAAPIDRRIIDNSQLESKWPVHGGVLIKDDKLYVSAGRSSLLDGGIALYALDPDSGDILAKNRLYDSHSEAESKMIQNDGLLDYREGSRRVEYIFNLESTIGIKNDILVSESDKVCMKQLQMNKNLETKGVLGNQFISMNGILNPDWLDRIGSFFGKPSNISNYSNADRSKYDFLDSPKQGSYMVFDEEMTYSVRLHPNLGKFRTSFIPGQKGYRIFADDNQTLPDPIYSTTNYSSMNRWNTYVPIRVEAMVATGGETLFLAGTPDVVDEDDPWGAIEGRKGGLLWALSADNGEKLAEYQMDSPPVFDGMIAANGKLYMATEDGNVICIGEKSG